MPNPLEILKKYAKATPEERSAFLREYFSKNPEVQRRIELGKKRNFEVSITPSEKDRAKRFKLSIIQLRNLVSRGRCDICLTLNSGTKLGWHIDHSHTAKKIRGLLCQRCNIQLLPVLEGDLVLILKALAYLEDPPGI